MTNTTDRKALDTRYADAQTQSRLARMAANNDPTDEFKAELASRWTGRVLEIGALIDALPPRTMRVAVAFTVEVDLDAYDAEYGTNESRSDIRDRVRYDARSAYEATALVISSDIAKVL